MLFGASAFLVGIFPGNTTPHPFAAMIAFVFSALTAIAAFRVTSGPFRVMSLFAGALSLVALMAGELGDNSPAVQSIGIGGTERWVVFPIILWLAFFGGYLLALGHRLPPDRPGRLRCMDQRVGEPSHAWWYPRVEPRARSTGPES